MAGIKKEGGRGEGKRQDSAKIRSYIFFHLMLVSVPVSRICENNKGANFMSKIPQTIDGAVVDSRDERDVDCVMTFQTESILEKFLLR